MTFDSTIAIIANIALALSFITAIIFGMVQMRAAERDRHERFTLGTLQAFQTREFAETIFFLRDMKFPKTGDEFTSLPKEQQIMMIQYSQQMESLGMMVHDKFIDLTLVDKTLGSFVSSMWEKYKPMFVDMRVTLRDPYLAEYFQWLAERIDKRMKEHPRTPFHEEQERERKMGHK